MHPLLAEVAERAGTTVAVVRRVVGKLDHDAIRQMQEETAQRIEDKRRSKEAGFDHHLTKPVEPAALAKLLATLKSGAA